MKAVILLITLVFAISAATVPQSRIVQGTAHLTGDELVQYVNEAQNLFTAERSSYFSHVPLEVKKRLMGSKYVRLPEKYRVNEKTHDDIDDSIIPEWFDAREKWPECSSLRSVRDQASCGSCWAVAAAETITDRICIASKGKQQFTISADDILSCCEECGWGCDGGSPIEAFNYWTTNGVVTGSNYTSKGGCKPYPYPPCDHHIKPLRFKACPKELSPTNACEYKCQSSYPLSYDKDKHYGQSAYAVAQKVTSIQKEIMLYGPVEVGFDVYADFEHYRRGVYKYTAGDYLGGHAVKLLGWGMENGIPYWLCANSWNSDWGDNGYFKILRGTDECGIESGVVAGLPKL